MELTRRRFLGLLVAGGLAVALGAWRGLTRAARVCRAAVFPGKIRPLRDEDIRKPGEWVG